MIYNKYKFRQNYYTDEGQELWIWIMWTVFIVGMIVLGSYSIGQLSAHDKYIYLVNGMVKQYEAGCEKPPVFKNVPVKK